MMEEYNWEKLASEIESVAVCVYDEFKGLGEEAVNERSGAGKWRAKEILGHLIDSAANNHHRFVRLQYNKVLVFADYDPPGWVRIENYVEYPWKEMLGLWSSYNKLLAHIVRNVNEETVEHQWQRDDGSRLTLAEIMIDYPKHRDHHLRKIRELVG